MIQSKSQSSTIKKLNYLLHKKFHPTQFNLKSTASPLSQEKSLDQSLNRSTALPLIAHNMRSKKISTQNIKYDPHATNPQKRQNQYRQSANTQISGKQYIEVNKSILKMIEEKIYPMNKQLTQKMKFKNHNFSCPTSRNNLDENENESIPNPKISKQKNKTKNKKKNHTTKSKPTDLTDSKIGLSNRQKRTKSQQEIIKLQAKVESYLRDRKKLLKFKYDQEMQQIVKSSLSTSKIDSSIKEQAKQRTIKRLLTVHSSKKKTKKLQNSAQNSLLIGKQSELKRIIKLFEERGNNHTTLETVRRKVSQTSQDDVSDIQQKKKTLKEITAVSSKDLSMSLKAISSIVNRKFQQLVDIRDADVKDVAHQKIITRVQNEENSRLLQTQQSLKKFRSKGNSMLKRKESSKLKLQNKENAFRQTTKRQNSKSRQCRRTVKQATFSAKQSKTAQSNAKQRIFPPIQKMMDESLKSQRSYKILPGKEGRALDKELLVQIQQELLDEKKNLLKKKINEKKLMKKRKESYVTGMAII